MKTTQKVNIRHGLHVGNLGSKVEAEVYSVDEFHYQNVCEIHTRAIGYYQRMASDYLALNLGPVSMEILCRVSSGDIQEFEQKFFAEIESNIERLGVTNEAIKNNMRAGTGVPWVQFKQSVETNRENIERVSKGLPGVPLDCTNYSLSGDGVLSFTDSNKQKVKAKYCTTYLDNAVKIEFVKTCEDTIRNIEKLKEILLRNNIHAIFGGRSELFEIVNSKEEQKIHFNKNIVKAINN